MASEQRLGLLQEAVAVIREQRAALLKLSLGGIDDSLLQSWCNEGWTCEHEDCVQGRAALQTTDEFLAGLK